MIDIKLIIPPHDLLECEECGLTFNEEESYFRQYDRHKKKWYGICKQCSAVKHELYRSFKASLRA